MDNKSSTLQVWLHRYMGPALFIMLGSSIFRGLLGIIIARIDTPYYLWPWYIQIPIEILVFIGICITSDVCYGATNGNCAAIKNQLVAIENEDTPVFRGKKTDVQANMKVWQEKQRKRLKHFRSELNTERIARTVFGFFSIYYALNFIVQISVGKTTSAMMQQYMIILTDALSVIIVPYVLWYYASRFRTESKDLAAKAIDIAETGIEKRLTVAGEHLATNQQDEIDVRMVDGALPAAHPYKAFIPGLRPVKKGDILTTDDIFQELQINDSALERRVRRILLKAFNMGDIGVWKDADTKEWRVSGDAYHRLFKPLLPGNRQAVTVRTRPKRHAAIIQTSEDMRPDNDSNETAQVPSNDHHTVTPQPTNTPEGEVTAQYA